ncbi:MAG: OmpA family protein [Ignavibacteria bacterium]|jgi:outer membrane protein OmpA-like peptidoglycan-associated protein/Mg-chelatase subunit ChlD|nr:OmpA family protein [Ignavibacteria bacterium]
MLKKIKLNPQKIICYIFIFFSLTNNSLVAERTWKDKKAEKEKKQKLLERAKIEADREEIDITVKGVDITRFPETKLLIEAYNKLGEPLDTLLPEQITIYENNIEFKALTVEKVPMANNLPWDLIFVIDITGSMQPQIDGVVENVTSFAGKLRERGIDYRLGLILFSDNIERVYQPTSNIDNFLSWIKKVRAFGGGDEKENALEALKTVTQRIQFRDEANRIAILITDAPYHQKGDEGGDGRTLETLESVIERAQRIDLRVFSITPPKLKNYAILSENTRGTTYNIEYAFSTVLDNFTQQITNLFYVTYRSEHTSIPDSIEIGLFDKNLSRVIKKTIPIMELGRKLIIENLLFQTAKYELPENVSELNLLADFMLNKKNIAILVEGHTDSVGSDAFNDNLSLKRANAVKTYLIGRGISADKIQVKGFGKKRPIASNDTDFGRSLNRRTEIVIQSK